MGQIVNSDLSPALIAFCGMLAWFVVKWFISNFLKKSSVLESNRLVGMESGIKQNADDIKELTKQWINENARLDERVKSNEKAIDRMV